jgi:hypothetical protein
MTSQISDRINQTMTQKSENVLPIRTVSMQQQLWRNADVRNYQARLATQQALCGFP